MSEYHISRGDSSIHLASGLNPKKRAKKRECTAKGQSNGKKKQKKGTQHGGEGGLTVLLYADCNSALITCVTLD